MKQEEVDHINHCAQAVKGLRRAKRHVFQNCPDDVFRVHIRNKHHLCKIPLEDLSPYFLYIDFEGSDSLSDQIAHAKVCSLHHYEQQILREDLMTQSCQNLYNLVESSAMPVAKICL